LIAQTHLLRRLAAVDRNRGGELICIFSDECTPELTGLAWDAIFPALVGA
jgi:hypothetical protein